MFVTVCVVMLKKNLTNIRLMSLIVNQNSILFCLYFTCALTSVYSQNWGTCLSSFFIINCQNNTLEGWIIYFWTDIIKYHIFADISQIPVSIIHVLMLTFTQSNSEYLIRSFKDDLFILMFYFYIFFIFKSFWCLSILFFFISILNFAMKLKRFGDD